MGSSCGVLWKLSAWCERESPMSDVARAMAANSVARLEPGEQPHRSPDKVGILERRICPRVLDGPASSDRVAPAG
jgi:hypothetical protein